MKKIINQKFINYCIHLPKALFWNFFYGFPAKKLKIIGVTGTDGKTTTANMLYHIFEKTGHKVGMVSTIGAKFNGKDLETGFHVTSPDPRSIQKFLKQMRRDGVQTVILETTSHALDQFRYLGIDFDFAVYTNITHEHFDYHINYENYVNAKLKLIDKLKPSGIVIANYDDKSFDYIQKKCLEKWGNKIDSHLKIYGKTNPDFKSPYEMLGIDNLNSTKLGINFTLKSILPRISINRLQSESLKLDLNMLGDYNSYNAAAAILTCQTFDNLVFKPEDSVNILSSFSYLEGRMEMILKGENKPTIIVDFAHTPNALLNALNTLKSLKPAKLITVFGCAGLRDNSKRSLMGEIAAKYSDVIILVPEDPRTESIKDINNQIEIGIKKVENRKLQLFRFEEPNVNSRIEGIKKSIEIACPDDIIVICGKGHEKSLCFGNTEYLYSDQETVKSLI
jgi:UDP-N-acetylmuramoyl-L-alanyl-D-glutamate--2,6-diaminopimelate ligase